MNTETQQPQTNTSPTKRKSWSYMLLIAVAILFVGYFSYNNTQNGFINHDYYRVLFEASNKLNSNLTKLKRMHQNNESIASIRSLLPSYTLLTYADTDKDKKEKAEAEAEKDDDKTTSKNYHYQFINNKLLIYAFNKNKKNEAQNLLKYELQIDDILPAVKQGFSQFIYTDEQGKVLTSNGGETTISFVDLTSISKEIAKKSRSFSFSKKSTEQGKKRDSSEINLPSYSSHVDMTISYGEFRVFIFPFKLLTPLSKGKDGELTLDDLTSDNSSHFENVYLVGLLPKHELQKSGSGHWNISLLIVTAISLVIMLLLIRLFLLPQNQAITRSYRYFTQFCCYAFYLVIISLLLAYLQKNTLQNNKDHQANIYAKEIAQDLNKDLKEVFTKLKDYRYFYYQMLQDIEKHLTDKSNETTTMPLSLAAFMPQKQLKSENNDDKGDIKTPFNLNISTAATKSTRYSVETKNNKNINSPCKSIFDNCMLQQLTDIHLSKYDKQPALAFFSKHLTVEVKPEIEIISYINESYSSDSTLTADDILPANILSTFTINRIGNTDLPTIIYREGNSLPQTNNLSHREYFKRVRDNRAWQLTFDKDNTFNNVYIQRLYNINNGTRGTTISMPMKMTLEELPNPELPHPYLQKLKSYVLGADILLPSVEMRAPLAKDYIYMVVNRNNGKVLFHSNESRSMVENLFYSGDYKSNLSQWIKAGLDTTPLLKGDTRQFQNAIKGHYHGQSGRFFIYPTKVDAWAVIVYYPDDSLDSLMTNQFLYIFIRAMILISVLLIIFFGCRKVITTLAPKASALLFPRACSRRFLLVSSVLTSLTFSINIFYDVLKDNLDILIKVASLYNWILVTFILYCFYFSMRYLFLKRHDLNVFSKSFWQLKTITPFKRLFFFGLPFTIIFLSYLQQTSQVPLITLSTQYQKQTCNKINLENTELNNTALTLFPNSITQHGFKAKDLLPTHNNWINPTNIKADVNKSNTKLCINYLSEIEPDDFPNHTTLMSTRYIWQWINNYFDWSKNSVQQTIDIHKENQTIYLLYDYNLFLFLTLLVSTMTGWVYFNKRILWQKLYCSAHFLKHIEKIGDAVKSRSTNSQSDKLTIVSENTKLNGLDLTFLIERNGLKDHSIVIHPTTPSQTNQTQLLRYNQLEAMSPFLQNFIIKNQQLPNLKIHIKQNAEDGSFNVFIWDVEVSLDNKNYRKTLLTLISDFKALVLSSLINSFTICAGFNSFQRIGMKNIFLAEHDDPIDNIEYLSWAECLMDFKTIIPEHFIDQVDEVLLVKELTYFSELKFILPKENTSKTTLAPPLQLMPWEDPLAPKNSREWSTINYILMHAEALYRFKWELCSSAEKLALFNLAKQRRLNPTNTKMIEHLALNGLIIVRADHLEIVNKSFGRFVLNAESSETISRLERHSEQGFWKSYRIPLALMMVLIIGGVAMTSGESIYIIAASLAGILTTIAGVTNSANLIKGQLK